MTQSSTSQIFVGVMVASILAIAGFIANSFLNYKQDLYYLTLPTVRISKDSSGSILPVDFFESEVRILNLDGSNLVDAGIAILPSCDRSDIKKITVNSGTDAVLDKAVDLSEVHDDGIFIVSFKRIKKLSDFSISIKTSKYCAITGAESITSEFDIVPLTRVKPRATFLPEWFFVFIGAYIGLVIVFILVKFRYVIIR